MIEEVEKLLEHCVEYATEILVDTGECYPFGAFVDTIGNVHPLEMEVEDKKNMPKIGQVMTALTTYCETEWKAEKLKGYALVYEVQLQLEEDADPIDALAIDMKHVEQDSIDLFYLPFSTKANNTVKIDPIFGVKRVG